MIKISDMRRILDKIEAEHGDIPMTAYQWNDPSVPAAVKDVKVIDVKPHYKRGKKIVTYSTIKNIKTGGIFGDGAFDEKYTKTILARPTQKVANVLYEE